MGRTQVLQSLPLPFGIPSVDVTNDEDRVAVLQVLDRGVHDVRRDRVERSIQPSNPTRHGRPPDRSILERVDAVLAAQHDQPFGVTADRSIPVADRSSIKAGSIEG